MAFKRLDKVISNTGMYSRKEISKIIKSGIVKVNGLSVTDCGMKIDPELYKITVGNSIIQYKEHYHIMLNKPAGVITATEDLRDKTVLDLIDDIYPKNRLCPAGRLDKDTEGFVFLTTDGNLSHRITGPKNHVEKTYFVKIDADMKDSFIDEFKQGVVLEDSTVCKSALLEISDIHSGYLTITEGKYHQVKRMFNSVGCNVVYLKRMSIGNVKLDDNLSLGEYRELTPKEVEEICLKK